MTNPLNPNAPTQIADIVGVDRMDTLDRSKLDPRIKLTLMALECRAQHGRDMRAGGFSIACRPRVALQIAIDLATAGLLSGFSSEFRLQRAVVLGSRDCADVGPDGADVVFWWTDPSADGPGVPLIVRSSVKNDQPWCVPTGQIPRSTMTDRQRAGQIRMSAHHGLEKLNLLRESE